MSDSEVLQSRGICTRPRALQASLQQQAKEALFLLLVPSCRPGLGTPQAAFGQAAGCRLGPQERVCNLEGELSKRGGGGVGEMPNEILRRTFISYSITSVMRNHFTLSIYI